MIKGQGKLEKQGNGGNRESRKGRGRFDFITYEAAEALAIWCEQGAEKYGDRNWENGLSVKDSISRMVGHAIKAANGWTDEDHLAAVMWNAMCAITMEKRKYMDEFRDHPWKGPHGEPLVHDEDICDDLKDTDIDYNNVIQRYKATDLDSVYLEMNDGSVLIKKPYNDFYMYFAHNTSSFWTKYKKSLDVIHNNKSTITKTSCLVDGCDRESHIDCYNCEYNPVNEGLTVDETYLDPDTQAVFQVMSNGDIKIAKPQLGKFKRFGKISDDSWSEMKEGLIKR